MPTDLSRLTFGQPYATLALARAIDGGRIGHAYLLHGPAMIGKTTLATAFAQALLCTEADRPCGHCRSCRDVDRGAHPDFRVLSLGGDGAPSRRGATAKPTTIGIDQIREMRLDSVLAPVRSQWRVFVVLGADHLTTEATNALLKTLEEPPPHVVLVLTAERLDALLPTIISRCQSIRLSSLPRAELARVLMEHFQVDEGRAYQLACVSRGRIGWAVMALSDPALGEVREDALNRLRGLLRDGTIGRLDAAARLADAYGKDRDEVFGVLDDWLGWWRDALLVKAGTVEMISNVDRDADLADVAGTLPVEGVRGAIRSISSTVEDLSANVNPRLAFENLVLSLPRP